MLVDQARKIDARHCPSDIAHMPHHGTRLVETQAAIPFGNGSLDHARALRQMILGDGPVQQFDCAPIRVHAESADAGIAQHHRQQHRPHVAAEINQQIVAARQGEQPVLQFAVERFIAVPAGPGPGVLHRIKADDAAVERLPQSPAAAGAARQLAQRPRAV